MESLFDRDEDEMKKKLLLGSTYLVRQSLAEVFGDPQLSGQTIVFIGTEDLKVGRPGDGDTEKVFAFRVNERQINP